MVTRTRSDRPAFYALAPGGWRDYVTLLHLPYTTWHLSYVVIGACLAPHVPAGRLEQLLDHRQDPLDQLPLAGFVAPGIDLLGREHAPSISNSTYGR